MEQDEKREVFYTKQQLARLIWPLLLEQFLAVTMGLADTFMVSSVSEAAVSSVSLVDTLNVLIFQILSALASGGAVVVSQYMGQKNYKQMKKCSAQLYSVLLISTGVTMIAAVIGSRGILRFIFGSIDDQVMGNAQIYFLISAVSYPFMGAYSAGAALFRAQGNSKVSMKASLVMNVINIFGNAMLIYGLRMGVTGAAAGIYAGLPSVKAGTAYRYTMESYYEAPYIFGIGWNLPKEEGTSASVALPDGGKLKVCFTDAAKGVIQDKKAMAALTKVLARLREETGGTDFPMTRPLVYQWKDTGGESQETLAERYYKEGDLPSFKTVFAGLDRPKQAAWMTKIYEGGSYAFFSVAAAGLETDGELVTAFAEKAYAGGAAGHFSILADRMSEETLGLWLERAKKDKQFAFQSILYNKLGMDRDLDELEARLDAAQAAQYKAVGVTMEGWDYYYKGKLVNIFLDLHRPDNSIITLNMNPEGTVNIKIVRNEKGAITGVAELTQEETERVFRYVKKVPAIVGGYQERKGFMGREDVEQMEAFAHGPELLRLMRSIYTPVEDLETHFLQSQKTVQKLILFFSDLEERRRVYGDMQERFADLAVSSAVANNIEVNASTANKGAALKSLRELLGLKREEVMAFGDGSNDITMLLEAGRGIAMGNACREAKEAADEVTLSNEEEGVAVEIEKLLKLQA